MIPARQRAFARRAVLLMLAMMMAFSGVGCGLPPKWHALAKKLPEATPEDPAYQMLCVWEPAEGIGPDRLPTRGFAGKITFFTRKQETGVRVKGDVRISVYDDQGRPEERGKPIHQWDFPGDAWAIHLQNSSIGPAYSVFIPYSRKGSQQAQCALRVRLKPENGDPLYSDTVAVLLPGPVRKKEEQTLDGESLSGKRTSLNSLTIPLKEKRQADLANTPLGQTEIHRTIAPASELPTKPPIQYRGQFRPTDGGPPGTSPSVTVPSPSAPRSFTPPAAPPRTLMEDDSAQPVPTTDPLGIFGPLESENPPSSRQPSPFENRLDWEDGSNPFNR